MIRCYILCAFLSLYIANGFQRVQLRQRPRKSIRCPVSQRESHRSFLEDQREELGKALEKIDELRSDLKRADSEAALSKSRSEMNALVDEVAKNLVAFIPPIGLSSEEYVNAMRMYLQLPPSIRYRLVRGLNMEGEVAGDYQEIPEIVARLYEQQTNPSSLISLIQNFASNSDVEVIIQNDTPPLIVETNITETEATFKTFFGYISRNTKTSPTSEDVATITRILKDAKFISNPGSPVEVPGAYIVPGLQRKVDAAKLLRCIDENTPENWECSVSLIYNNFQKDLELFEKPGCALLVYKTDFSSSNSWIYYLSTLSALATSLVFSFNIFGKNEGFDVSSLDTSIASIEDVSGFLVPFFAILLLSELGHSFMAQKDNFKTRFLLPALLPFPQGLPLYGSITRISSPPSNLTSLLDFAVVGPILGFISSLGFMVAGIGMSSQVDGQAPSIGALPSLSVGTLKLSTLGGSLIDYINGGSGFITAQANDALISLHPFFIAGFCGMILSAVSLIPVGATNGGRMSLAIFGRQGHAVISGFTWLALLVSTFVLDDDKGLLLTTALLINSFGQNDMEIPCRNETDEVDGKRLVLSFSLWFLAVLILVPL